MRYGETARGAARALTRLRTRAGLTAGVRLAAGRVPLWAMPIFLAPVAVYLAVSRSWHGLAALAAVAFAALVTSRPVALAALIPVSVLGGALPGAGATVTLAAIAVVVLVVDVQIVAGTRRPRRVHLLIALLALLLLAGFLFPAGGPGTETDRLADLMSVLAGLGLTAAVTASPPPASAVARVTAVTGACTALVLLPLGDRPGGRLAGLGVNPNFLGAFLALGFVAAAGLVVRRRRPGWLLPAAACLAGMVATQSRGAFAAAAAGVLVVAIQGRRRGVQALAVTAAVALCALFPATIDAAERVAVGRRQAAELSHDTSVRESVARFAARVAAGHPIRGIGYGTFPSYADAHFGVRIATHNDYLRLAAETGIPVLVVFLVLLWLGLRRPAGDDLAVPRAVVAAYAAGLLFANELSNLILSTPFWLSLGCLLAARPRPDRTVSAQKVSP
jgi:O-antigen ligase